MRRFRISREERRGRTLPLWKNFRAWWGQWRLEWVAICRHWHIDFNVDPGEREVQFSFGCGLFAFWLSREIHSKALWDWFHKRWRYNEMTTGVDWNACDCPFWEGFLHWQFWVPRHDWSSSTPKWRDGSFHVWDFVFGRNKHSERTITTHEAVEIPMPEATYLADIRIFESEWRRPRSLFVTRMVRSDINMRTPIPTPGKGENSWDCGEDALHSLTCPATTVYDAIAATVGSVMRSRHNYGGKNWRPAVKEAAA